MKMIGKFFVVWVVGALAFIISLQANGQSPGYTKLNVGGRVTIDVPSDWTINDDRHIKRVKQLAESLMGAPMDHMASLSVHSHPRPSRLFVRVSFVSTEPPITQKDVRHWVTINKQGVLSDLADAWEVESSAMWAALRKNGIQEVGKPSFAVDFLGGKYSLIIRYARTSVIDPAQTMRVVQHHVLLGDVKALITLSYIDGDQAILEVHNRLKNSIVIQ